MLIVDKPMWVGASAPTRMICWFMMTEMRLRGSTSCRTPKICYGIAVSLAFSEGCLGGFAKSMQKKDTASNTSNILKAGR